MCSSDLHNKIAEYYDLPSVSIKDSIYEQIKLGKYEVAELTSDGLHPNDKGHALVAAQLIKLLEDVKEALPGADIDEAPVKLKVPLTVNAFQQTRRLTIGNSNPVLEGFHVDTTEKKGHLDTFKDGWIGREVRDKITFEVEGSCIAVQYRKTINKPSPIAQVIIDGQRDKAVILDGNFEHNWGDCLYLEPVLYHGKKAKHKVEIEVIGAGQADKAPFYLLALLVS